jgi:hypothetical protein
LFISGIVATNNQLRLKKTNDSSRRLDALANAFETDPVSALSAANGVYFVSLHATTMRALEPTWR